MKTAITGNKISKISAHVQEGYMDGFASVHTITFEHENGETLVLDTSGSRYGKLEKFDVPEGYCIVGVYGHYYTNGKCITGFGFIAAKI